MPNPNTGPFSPITPFAAGAGAAGALEAVSKLTLGVNTNPVDIVGFDNTAQIWEIRFRLWMAVAASIQLRIRTGGSFETGFDYLYHVMNGRDNVTTYGAVAPGANDRIQVSAIVVGATEARATQGVIKIFDPGNTVSRKQIHMSIGMFDSTNRFFRVSGWGVWDGGVGAIDQLRFFSAQDFASGSEFALFKQTDFA